jgi:hypothetical protein
LTHPSNRLPAEPLHRLAERRALLLTQRRTSRPVRSNTYDWAL